MSKKIDLTGQKFGKWTVLTENGIKQERPAWLCKCECGTFKVLQGCSLRSGNTKSCGCLQKEAVTKHGISKSSTHNTWTSMLQRCNNSNNDNYKHYGARGITVCKRWTKFENFYEDMGKRPKGLTLERINNNKGYFKENCKWATMTEQARNRRPIDRNKIGLNGITIDRRRNTKNYRVSIGVNYKIYNLGTFSTLEEAIKARKQGEQKYWK